MKIDARMADEAARINSELGKDPRYLRLAARCQKFEDEYCRILRSLSQEDQDILEEYIALCQELEYRRARIAAELTRSG